MNSLFIRIWIANWLVFVFVVFSSIFVFQKFRDAEIERQANNLLTTAQELKTRLLKAVAEGEKPESWALRLSEEEQPVFLLQPNGKDLSGRRVPRSLIKRESAQRLSSGAPPNPVLAPIRIKGYPPLDLVILKGRPKRPYRLYSPAILIGLAFFASGLAAVLLARYISLPIKQLHLASDRIASGDFDTNVAASVGYRKDEIADLARRFDLMAKALDTANRNQRDLLRDVSHELRSPLTRLLLISDLLTNAQGEQQQSLQQRLKKDLGELENLIDEVMVLAKFNVEAGALHFEQADLISTLYPLIEDAKFEANALNKTVTFLHDEYSYCVNLSPIHFCRAIENVVRNAIRHTHEHSEVLVEVLRDNDKASNKVVICVSDNGDGLDEDELNKIFSPFYRSANARAKYKGAGIGLALAERIVNSHQGTINAKNLPQGGLQVRISLPAV